MSAVRPHHRRNPAIVIFVLVLVAAVLAAGPAAAKRLNGVGVVKVYVYAPPATGVPGVEVFVWDGAAGHHQCTDASGKAVFLDMPAGSNYEASVGPAVRNHKDHVPCQNTDFRTGIGTGSKMYWMKWDNHSQGSGADKFSVTTGSTTPIQFYPVIPVDQTQVCGGVQVTIWGANGTSGNDVIMGSSMNDAINGGSGDDKICGGGGNDTLNGGPGNDRLMGGDGDDFLDGRDGNDWLIGGTGKDTMQGKSGNDVLVGQPGKDKLNGGDGDDWLSGGADKDQINYSAVPAPGTITVSLTNGWAGPVTRSDNLDSIEDVVGTNGPDLIEGSSKVNFIKGLRGGDTIYGHGGNDNLVGQGGNDTLLGGPGNDRLFGKAGQDDLRGDDGNDYLEGNLGDDDLLGGAGTDYLFGGGGHDTCIAGETEKGCEQSFP